MRIGWIVAVIALFSLLIPNIALAMLTPYQDVQYATLLINIFQILDQAEDVKLVALIGGTILGFWF